MSDGGWKDFAQQLGITLENSLLVTQEDKNLLRPWQGGTASTSLMYPYDLFDHGAQAFIFFNIRSTEGEDAVPSYGSVVLYMPATLRVMYQSKWTEVNMPLQRLSEISSSAAALNNAMDTLIQNGTMHGLDIARGVAGDIIDMTAAVANGVSGVANTQAAAYAMHTIFNKYNPSYAAEIRRKYAGKFGANSAAVNPFAALTYEHQNFREVQFSFDFFARSEDESKAIRKIIKLFKLASHPAAVPGGQLFYDGAFVFDIYLFTPSLDNMFNMKKAALTMMEIDYSPAQMAPSFHKDGHPTNITLSMTFKELSLLTRNDIYDNY